MKKISMILGFALFSIALNACKKDDGGKFCASCTVKTTMSSNEPGDIPMNTETTLEQCDLTQSMLNQLVKEGSSTTTSKVGDFTMTVKSVMSCDKK